MTNRCQEDRLLGAVTADSLLLLGRHWRLLDMNAADRENISILVDFTFKLKNTREKRPVLARFQ